MDDQALSRLFDAHGRRLFRFLLAILGRPEDAEDALQNLFVKLARGERPEGPEKLYLDRAARNEAITIIRRRRAPPDPERLSPREGASEEDAEVVEAALARLPAEQAEVVLLKVYEERTFAEIGDALAISPDTAASRYRRGLAKLRGLFASRAPPVADRAARGA